MKKDVEIFTEHILECVERIEEYKYTEGITKDEFLKSTEIQDAVIRRIEIIGEAVKIIPAVRKIGEGDLERVREILSTGGPLSKIVIEQRGA